MSDRVTPEDLTAWGLPDWELIELSLVARGGVGSWVWWWAEHKMKCETCRDEYEYCLRGAAVDTFYPPVGTVLVDAVKRGT